MSRATVFISYSHAGEAWKDRLVGHLGVLEREGLIAVWADRQIGVPPRRTVIRRLRPSREDFELAGRAA